jgi:hypothetical protein
VSTESSGALGFDFGALIDSITTAIEDNTDNKLKVDATYGRDPCARFSAGQALLNDFIRPRTDSGIEAVSLLTAALKRSVKLALEDQGRSGIGYAGVEPFPSFLARSGVVNIENARRAALAIPPGPPNFIALGVLDAAWANDLSGRIAPGRPSNKNRGFKLSPGAYFFAGTNASDIVALDRGILTGSRVRRTWDAWRRIVIAGAHPPGAPWARDVLALLAGPQAAEYPFRRSGTPYERGSKMARLLEKEEGLERLTRRAEAECRSEIKKDRQDAERSEARAASIERQRIQAAQTTSTGLLIAGAVVAIALIRRTTS